jgi:thiol-disulfide isomerase/thioredoxin
MLTGGKRAVRKAAALTVAALAAQIVAVSVDAAAPSRQSVAIATDAQIKVLEQAVKQNPNACAGHLNLGKTLCKKAAAMKKGCSEQTAAYRRGVNELRVAIRKGKGNAMSVAANHYLMRLPKHVIAPRTDSDTPLIAVTHGLCGLSRGGDGAKPKVLEFYASWCQPCKMLKPLIEKAKTEYGDKIEFVSYNVDDPTTEKLMEDYEVSPIPTLIFLGADNQVISYSIGYSGETGIHTGLKKILASSSPTTTAPAPANSM